MNGSILVTHTMHPETLAEPKSVRMLKHIDATVEASRDMSYRGRRYSKRVEGLKEMSCWLATYQANFEKQRKALGELVVALKREIEIADGGWDNART